MESGLGDTGGALGWLRPQSLCFVLQVGSGVGCKVGERSLDGAESTLGCGRGARWGGWSVYWHG